MKIADAKPQWQLGVVERTSGSGDILHLLLWALSRPSGKVGAERDHDLARKAVTMTAARPHRHNHLCTDAQDSGSWALVSLPLTIYYKIKGVKPGRFFVCAGGVRKWR